MVIVRLPEAMTNESRIGLSSGCLPRRTGKKLKLSGPASTGSSVSRIAANVANRSTKLIVWSLTEPGLTFSGQRTTNGMRWPASHASAFMPRRPPDESWPKRSTSVSYQTGPLSDEKITSVSSVMFASSTAFRIRPIMVSTIITKSPYIPAPLRPTNSGDGSQGVCGAG